MQQEPSLVRLSELQTMGLGSHISQGIDRSVGTKNNLARQDELPWGQALLEHKLLSPPLGHCGHEVPSKSLRFSII